MNEQLTFYKLFAEKQYTIEIPIIQRDYAQGRKSASNVRNLFLEAIYGYLAEGKPFRDLDFVYGDIDVYNNFIPLDGQQRLTTLFLLHWYLAVKEGKIDEFREVLTTDGFSRFAYKTRQSATDFCNALLKHTIHLHDLMPEDKVIANALSKTIRDSFWYFLPWDNDPTVRSMLCMLDAIHVKFKDTNGFYDLLIDSNEPVITFQFLELKDYGLTDDLYIKMNSRGKPLTKFENFKAKFEQHLAIFNEAIIYLPNLQEYFAHAIDTKWAALFWTFRDKTNNFFDRQLMNFISAIAINDYSLLQSNPKQFIDSQDSLSFDFYLDRKKDFIVHLVDTLDMLSKNPKYTQYLPNFHYYDEIGVFKSVINNTSTDAGYVERVKFFAYYAFLAKWKTSDGLDDWMRVIVNLTENTAPYNSELTFVNSLRSIHKMLPNSNRIIEYLTGSEGVSGFNPSQVKDEQMKAHLILRGQNWAEKIYEAEKHPYFKGQLISAIAFSGIEINYDEENGFKWDQGTDEAFFQSFCHYITILSSLFNEDGLIEIALSQYRLHRAVLSKGDYLIYAKSNFSFLNASDRDVSWKRFLQGDGERKNKRKYFQMVIDDPAFDISDLLSLENICEYSLQNLTGWRRKFVENPKLISYLGPFKYVRFESSNEIYLLSGSKMNGEHAELFTYSLYCYLEKALKLEGFKTMHYHFVKTDKEQPCIYFTGFSRNENSLELDILYKSDRIFELLIFERSHNQINYEIESVLTSQGLNGGPKTFRLNLNEEDIVTKLTLLFKQLSEIPH